MQRHEAPELPEYARGLHDPRSLALDTERMDALLSDIRCAARDGDFQLDFMRRLYHSATALQLLRDDLCGVSIALGRQARQRPYLDTLALRHAAFATGTMRPWRRLRQAAWRRA